MVKIGRVVPRRRSTPTTPLPPPKVALLIGIDYVHAATPDYPRLHRARSDTKAFRDLLINNYNYLPENVTMMLDEDGIAEELWPARQNILNQIEKLVGGAQSGSRFVFFFSGHSGQVPDPENREADGLDEYIVPADHIELANDGTGRPTKKVMILDNTLRKKLVNPLHIGANLTAIFDSCHSGTMLDLDHYLCNSVYHPWTDIGFRRHLTKWLGVRRKDGQRMSQAGVKIIMRKAKRVHPDMKGKGKASVTPTPSREGSGCSVRIHQRKRLSNNQMETIDVALAVTDSEDGMRRELSYSSRRSSIQCKPSASISQIMEGDESMNSLVKNDVDIPRCASPTDMECNGFCPEEPEIGGTPESATVVSISSCHDNQRTWESKHGSFTHWLIEQLRPDPHQPIGRFTLAMTHRMYSHAQKTHAWSLKQKNKITSSHSRTTSNSSGESSASGSSGSSVTIARGESEQETYHLDCDLEYSAVPVPVLGSQSRLDLEQPISNLI